MGPLGDSRQLAEDGALTSRSRSCSGAYKDESSSSCPLEIAFIKRPSNNWQLNVSYSATWLDIPVTCAGATGIGIGNFPSRCVLDPNTRFNTANNTVEGGLKISGAYDLPYGIVASANYEIRSGTPQARQVVFIPPVDFPHQIR